MVFSLFSLLFCVLGVGTSYAERHHEVRAGQTLSSIAHKYHVEVGSLASANGMDRQSTLRQGDVLRVPQPGVLFVGPGQSLSTIAKEHGVSVAALAKANRIKDTATIQVGQRLVLPGHKRIARAAKRWGQPSHPGRVTIVRSHPQKRLRMRLLNNQGRPRPAGRRMLARLLAERGSGEKHLPHPRLLRLLTQVSDHFGGRPLVVISGYRRPGGYTSDESRHTKGRAIDFRVQGVSNKELRDYLRRFDAVGVGYYPRSTFVHLDVRRKNAYWVDLSGPGEAPRIRRKRHRSSETRLADSTNRTGPEEVESEIEESEAPSQNETEGNNAPQTAHSAESKTPAETPPTGPSRQQKPPTS